LSIVWSNQFDLESLEYFKIREDLEEVSIMKSVPNLVSYLHNLFWNFSQFLAIYFELFSSEVIFNTENADEWRPPVSRRFLHRARLSARRRRMAAMRPRRATRAP
jgi:hypothetical protein